MTGRELSIFACVIDTVVAPAPPLPPVRVTDAAPAGRWCWAAQAAEAITAMQALVSEAIAQGRDAVDPAALAGQLTSYRSAALTGASQTAARRGKLMKKHNALARRLLDRSYSASVSGLMWRACVVVLCGGFESGREPCVAVEEVAEGVELADAPFGGGG